MNELMERGVKPYPVVVRVGHRNPKSPVRRRLLGSVLAALVGWQALALPVLIGYVIDGGVDRLGDFFAIAGFSFLAVFLTWWFCLLPLYLLIPRRSVLWRWPVCTICGALAGPLIWLGILAVLNAGRHFPESFWTRVGKMGWEGVSYLLVAAYVDAATCLFGALTAPRFHDLSNPKNIG